VRRRPRRPRTHRPTGAPVVRFENVSAIFCSEFDLKRKYAIRYMFSWGLKKLRALRPGEVFALQNVSLTINKGDIYWVTGTPKSGKSTIVKLIGGSLVPDVGRVKVNGSVRMVGAGFRWNGFMTIRENLRFLGLILGVKKDRLAAYVDEVLAFTASGGIAGVTAGNFSKKAFGTLSLVATLFADADIYVFDGKEIAGEGEIKTKLALWMQERLKDKTMIVVTSGRPSFPFKWAPTRGVIMHEGKVRWEGPADRLLDVYDAWAAEMAAAQQTDKPERDREEDDEEDMDDPVYGGRNL
jgi:ABC-type polysaccharide/polyol phosphate transport system ATPase subunit